MTDFQAALVRGQLARFDAAIAAAGPVRIKVTGRAVARGGGGRNASWARGQRLRYIFGAR